MFMRIDGRDVEVVVHDPAATEADLAAAAGRPRRAEPRSLTELGLRRGGELPGERSTDREHRPGVEVTVVGGLDAGTRATVAAGTVASIGRSDTADLVLDDAAASRSHARLAVDRVGVVAVTDTASRNGTWLVDDGVGTPLPCPTALSLPAELRLGRSRLRVGAADDDTRPRLLGRPSADGTVAHNRPPRPALPPGPGPVAVPIAPAPHGPRLPLGVVAVLGPVAMAGAMVWLLGNPAFALFALLSPVLVVGGHLEGRRRERRGARDRGAAWRADLQRFGVDLTIAAGLERRRRHASAPDPAEVVARAAGPATSLWERRPGDDDWLRLRVGTGDVPWCPPVRDERHGPRHDDVVAALAGAAVLPGSPVTVELRGGGVVGVVGPRRAACAVARCLLVQAAVHHGPADLEVLVACSPAAVPEWEWTKWLPHVEDVDGGPRRLAPGRAVADALADGRLDRWRAGRAGRSADRPPGATGPTLLAIVDGDELLEGRRAPLRSVLDGRGGPAAGIVVAASAERLPASCTAIVQVDDDGAAEVRVPALGQALAAVDADGVSVAVADRAARDLARLDDPELDVAGAGLPALVSLLDLLDIDGDPSAAIAERWASAGIDPRPAAPLGVDAAGTVTIDLAADGPHALVAGTTGAGKSELLRSLVAGLATGASPDHLTFLLVDFKGGSAFDACARLPHVVGVVTDLDAALAERALRCLEAELRHRERVLRDVGAADLAAYRSDPGRDPLPRLVVVVDEFATLKAELPTFVDALVGVAQRGRSLGVHLVLATQRPAGAVNEHIKANANLRIALRVQDPADSVDVVDEPVAATIPRTRPGRACIRLGPGELLLVQTALATAAAAPDRPAVELRAFGFGPGPATEAAPRQPSGATAPRTDLDRLVDACREAFTASGRPPPRRPWPPPLPEHLPLEALAEHARLLADGTAVVGLADDPDRQAQRPIGWCRADGNLAVYGVGGSGTTSTLLAVARSLAMAVAPDDLQLFVLDGGAGQLALLGALPHVAAVIGPSERERQQRLVRHLRADLDRRRAAPGHDRPEVVVLVDGIGRFLAEFDDLAGMEVVDAFGRVFTDGPEVGIRAVVAAERAGALPAALAATVRQRWVHRLADAVDAGSLGVAGPTRGERSAALPSGRFVDVASGLEAHVAVPAEGWPAALAEVAARWPRAARSSFPTIRALPRDVPLASLPSGALGGPRPWRLPVAVGEDDDEQPVCLVLHEGDHVLVAGPGRSGRTTALATVAAAIARVDPAATVVGLAHRRSWLPRVPGIVATRAVPSAVGAVGEVLAAGRPAFLLVDDADAVDDEGGALEALLGADGVHVVAAARNDVARSLYQHWLRRLRRSRLGILLRPDADLDGELLGAVLPRRSTAPWVDGRGYLVVDGAPTLVQVARCKDAEP